LGGNTPYKPLAALSPTELSASRNVILLVFDGLGYEYLMNNGRDTIFYEHLQGQITSVFPSTTAACVTTFATGVAPQQHAVTGWFVYLKEVGAVSAILPFKPRYDGPPFSRAKVRLEEIVRLTPLSTGIKAKAYQVMPKGLVKSDYTRMVAGQAKLVPYKNLGGFLNRIGKLVRSGKESRQQYIYAYWPEFDTLSHKHGNGSQKTAAHFRLLNKKFASFLKSIRNTDTTIIVTADHGFVDAQGSAIIRIEDHPQLMETLTLPLCGEGRAAYCYVRPAKVDQFETYIAEHLSNKCELFKSEGLIARNYFGLFEPNPKLFDRVGDYVLLMKDNYVLRDSILGESRHMHIGYHGGISKAEMLVPLIVVRR
jgi:predicted AlkP superfamily pyrophosphatase or phosphodiesterase